MAGAGGSATGGCTSKKDDERNEKIIRGLMKLPSNRSCINCNCLGPQYVCTSFWTFVCVTCGGIHREFTHRVKSVSMATFTNEEVEALQKGGNQRAKENYMAALEPLVTRTLDSRDVNKIRDFIRSVYVDQLFTEGKSSGRPPRDMQNRRHHDEHRRASSYHSYLQSPPYDCQYEEKHGWKQTGMLSRKPGSDRGYYGEGISSFSSSPSSQLEQMHEDRFADGGSDGSRNSDFSGLSTGDRSPNFQCTWPTNPPGNSAQDVDSKSKHLPNQQDAKPPRPATGRQRVDLFALMAAEPKSSEYTTTSSETQATQDVGWATFDQAPAFPQNINDKPSSTSITNLLSPTSNNSEQSAPSQVHDPSTDKLNRWFSFDEVSTDADVSWTTELKIVGDKPRSNANNPFLSFDIVEVNNNGSYENSPCDCFSFQHDSDSFTSYSQPPAVGVALQGGELQEHRSTNPFDLVSDTDTESVDTFMDLSVLEDVLPPTTFNTASLPPALYPHDVPPPHIGSPLSLSHFQSIASLSPVASIGRNPFA